MSYVWIEKRNWGWMLSVQQTLSPLFQQFRLQTSSLDFQFVQWTVQTPAGRSKRLKVQTTSSFQKIWLFILCSPVVVFAVSLSAQPSAGVPSSSSPHSQQNIALHCSRQLLSWRPWESASQLAALVNSVPMKQAEHQASFRRRQAVSDDLWSEPRWFWCQTCSQVQKHMAGNITEQANTCSCCGYRKFSALSPASVDLQNSWKPENLVQHKCFHSSV